jgi:hypothetical protein
MRSLGFLAAVFILVGSANAQQVAPNRGQPTADGSSSLPKPFAAVLPEIKARSRVPVLLPSEISKAIAGAGYAFADKASENEYAILLYFKPGIGDAGFAASFAAQAHPGYEPQELPNVRKVKLSDGIIGYFRPASCGGSCAPANVWWEEHRVLYLVQAMLSPATSENDQQLAITAIADSAILAGPR